MSHERTRLTRRSFLGQMASLPLATSAALREVSLPSSVSLVPDSEPGERLILTGTVYGPDGRTPSPGVRLDVYHTDAEGYYSRPVSSPRNARIRGSVRTDAAGRYRIHTIRPGHYEGITVPPPQHIHIHVSGPDIPHHWIDSVLFAGDPYLRPEDFARERELGACRHITQLTRDADGRLRATRDIRIDLALAERNQLVNGWYRQ